MLMLFISLWLSPGSGPPRGDEEQEREPEGGAAHPRCIHVGPRGRGAAGTPRKRLEGAFGARFRLRCLAGAGTREVKRLSDFLHAEPGYICPLGPIVEDGGKWYATFDWIHFIGVHDDDDLVYRLRR